MYGNPIGNPSYDTQLGVHRVGTLLQEKLGEVTAELTPPQGLIVFTGERVRLRIERCSFPVTTGREVRRVVTRNRNRLSAAQLARLREVLEQVRTT
jgi:hypothetical protein